MKRLVALGCLFIIIGLLFGENLKYPKKAMLFSALIPGMGELYSGNSTKAAIFLSSEAAIWLTYARLEQEMKWAKHNYMEFAYQNAGLPINSDGNIYRLMEEYTSSDDYNREIELNVRNNLLALVNDPSVAQTDREYYAQLLNDPTEYASFISDYTYTGDEAWDWNNLNSYHKYYNLRKTRQELVIYKNFAVSATIINRIVSIVDAALVAKKWNRFHQQYGYLDVQPDFRKKGVKLVYTIHF
jgi:hypothetical protein